jgi:hypothetical protein
MTSFGKLGDDLMKVPRLEAGGTNWVVYKDRFVWSVDARGLLEHMDGSEREPVCPVKPRMVPKKDSEGNDTREMAQAALTADEERLIKEWKAELKEWKRGEAIVKQQIAATIPDSLFMKIRDKGTALEIWEALKGDFQNKSRMVAVDLRRRLQQERCAEKGDVRAHFSKLRTMREDLAAMGHTPGDDEFYAIILGSLPYSFEPFISALNATSSVLGTVLSPDELMQAFTDEYDRRSLGKSSKKEEENAAFSTEEGNGRKGNGQRGKCFNCGKPGHRKDDCWEEGGGGQKPDWLKEKERWQKEREGGSNGKDKPKAKESAKRAEIEEDVAWMAYLSDSEPEDDDDRSVDWWDEPVEGENEDFDEQVDKAGNQPIPQPSKPETTIPKGTELPLAQPEEQEKCRGKAASGESTDDDEWAATATADATEDRDPSYETAKGEVEWPEETGAGVPLHTPYPKSEPAWEYYSDVVWNPWAVDEIEGESKGTAASGGNGEGAEEANRAFASKTTGQRKVNPSTKDDAKSNPRTPIHARSNFDNAEHVSRPMDNKNILLNGQNPSEITKTSTVPFREGIGPLTHTPRPATACPIASDAKTPKFREEPSHFSLDKSRGRGGASWVNLRKHAERATRLKAGVHDFRDLEGAGNISLASIDEKGNLPVFEDPGGVLEHRRGGYQPIANRKPVPGTPRKGGQRDVVNEGREDEGATVGRQMWSRGPPDPFWKMFPPRDVNKPPDEINGMMHAQTLAHAMGLRSD